MIGVGLEASTSRMLPPACDEFLFYERLEGVNVPERKRGSGRGGRGGKGRGRAPAAPAPAKPQELPAIAAEAEEVAPPAEQDAAKAETDLEKLVTQTISGLQRSSGGAVLASTLKRAMLRKDPTFSEADYGFRAFGELLRHLENKGVIELSQGAAKGDPEVSFPEESTSEEDAFQLLARVVDDLQTAQDRPPPLSGLKNELRRHQPDFSEKAFGFGGFLQFAKAARTRGLIDMRWDEEADDYVLSRAETAA